MDSLAPWAEMVGWVEQARMVGQAEREVLLAKHMKSE